jgi:AraC family transcriptional regulator
MIYPGALQIVTSSEREDAGQFIDILATRRAVGIKAKRHGLLNTRILKRLKDFVFEHLDEPLDVATLAKMTNRSQFHFSRTFDLAA